MGRVIAKRKRVAAENVTSKVITKPKTFLNYTVQIPDGLNDRGFRQINIIAETSFPHVSLQFARYMSQAAGEFINDSTPNNKKHKDTDEPLEQTRVLGFQHHGEEDEN